MSLTETETGPGQGDAPARAAPRELRFWLSAADALVWEQCPREFTRAEKRSLVLALFGLGMGYALIEDRLPTAITEMAALYRLLIVAALFYLGQMVWMNLRQRRRARRRFPRPVEMICDAAPGQLRLRPVAEGPAPFEIRPETIRQVVLHRGYLFIDAVAGLAILPQSAFATADEMAGFAAEWDAASEKAAP